MVHTHFIDIHILYIYIRTRYKCINQFNRTWVSWHSQGQYIYIVQQRFLIISPSQANKDERFNFLFSSSSFPFSLSPFQLNSVTALNQMNSLYVCLYVYIIIFIIKQTRCNQKWIFEEKKTTTRKWKINACFFPPELSVFTFKAMLILWLICFFLLWML